MEIDTVREASQRIREVKEAISLPLLLVLVLLVLLLLLGLVLVLVLLVLLLLLLLVISMVTDERLPTSTVVAKEVARKGVKME